MTDLSVLKYFIDTTEIFHTKFGPILYIIISSMTMLILCYGHWKYSNLSRPTVGNNVKTHCEYLKTNKVPPVSCCTPHHSIDRRVFLAAGVCCGQLFWSVIGVYLPVLARVIIKDYITGPRWVLDGWPTTIFNWENLRRAREREIAI